MGSVDSYKEPLNQCHDSILRNACLKILSSKLQKKSSEQFRELNKRKGGILIHDIENRNTCISYSDCQKLQICEYLISRTTSIFESLNPLSFSVTN